MDQKIKNEIVKIFNISENKINNLERFKIGMSNFTYFFEIDNDKYVIRLSGKGAFKYVDYNNELNAIIACENEELTSKLIYFDVDNGTKVSKYIEGSPFVFYHNEYSIDDLIETLKKLHSLDNKSVKDYDLINRLENYEKINKDDNNFDEKYLKIKTWWINEYNEKFVNDKKVFCHNDLQTVNIIYDENKKVKLIDFEYAAYNDLYYDLACFEENAFYVFEKYFGIKPTKEDIYKIVFFQIFQCLQWYQVAFYKERIGFSKETNYDFKALEEYFINTAFKEFKTLTGGL